ncbi:MAG: TIGR02391 family protein [Bacteroidales bacterium]|nr:TIGR02391 family protein [Bacteroidales bacterium]
MKEQLRELELKFDPQTIKHLGVKMYSTLSPAIAELISNAYDADSSEVHIKLEEENNIPKGILVSDNGEGLSYDEINDKFLVIGRNRRLDEGDQPSKKYKRRPTGKKGLGKLALFGLANTIIIRTIKNNTLNEFVLDWEKLSQATGVYKPDATIVNEPIICGNGTTIILQKLKRVTPFNPSSLADSLSRFFIFDNNFNVSIETMAGDKIIITNKRKYETISREFEWKIETEPYIPSGSEYSGKINGELITAEKPLSPQSGLRGVTLFSRGKLVNVPEFFSNSTSSHFFQYLTGWFNVDFIDELEDDVISTNRQSLDWENPDMQKLRDFLSGIISQINQEWRKKRKEKKERQLSIQLSSATGIDTGRWLGTMPADIQTTTQNIIDALGGEDTDSETFVPVMKWIHTLIPEYPSYHWRHLHSDVQEKSRTFYEQQNYYTAFLESMKKYVSTVREKSGSTVSPDESMMGNVFSERNSILSVIGGYKKHDGTDFSLDTIRNVQSGQQHLSQGVVAGGRNPLSHEEISELNHSDLFSESDCLDFLSLLSHLFKRLDNSKKV